MKNVKCSKFCLLLYKDDETHLKALEYIKHTYDYALINHNKDVDENGELKKEHYHIVMSVTNGKFLLSLSDELKIAPNYIQKCESFDKALAYLIHYNNPDKYQYSIDEVDGNLKDKLVKALEKSSKKCDDDYVKLILDFIFTFRGHLSLTNFNYFIVSQNLWSTYRRSAVIFLKMIEEHNRDVALDLQNKLNAEQKS